MSGEKADQQEEAKRLETHSVERRRLIGQAIIGGILVPRLVILSERPHYNQSDGNYTERGHRDHVQTGHGDYTSGPRLTE